MILHYSPLVKYVAGRVGVGLPSNIDQSDLVSYGIFGLIDAIDKFDLTERSFETYAISRIRGAIIDELRSIDWIPRSIRSKRAMLSAYSTLEAKLQRSPSEQEVADELGVPWKACVGSLARCHSSTLSLSMNSCTSVASEATRRHSATR